MAVTWGAARTAGGSTGNGVRVGIDLTYSGSGSTRTVVFELWLWTRRSSFGNSVPYSREWNYGSSSGTFGYSHTSSSSWSTANRTRIGRWTQTVTLQYGSTTTVTAEGTITNSGLGGTMPSGTTSHSRSITLPARSYNSPSTPTNVSVSRNSDTSHTVSARIVASSSAPVMERHWQRRVWNEGWSGWVTRARFTSPTYTSSGNYSWTDTGTRENRVYQWRVRVVNPSGSATSSSTGSHWTSPWRPYSITARGTAQGIRISWLDQTAYGLFVVDIQHRENGGSWQSLATVSGGAVGERSYYTHTDPDVSVTHQYRLRARNNAAGAPGLTSAWNLSPVVGLAAPPNAPRITGPNVPVDVDEPVTLTYAYAPTDGSEQQSRQVRWRLAGEQGWVTLDREHTDSGSVALDVGEPGVVEVQVRTWGAHPDPSPWSATHQILLVEKPTVSINAPDEGELIETSTATVEWGYSQGQDEEDESPQAAWRLTLLVGGQVAQEHSGTGDDRALQLRNLEDDTDYTVRLQVRSGHGLWSDAEESHFSVSYVLPQAPTIESVTWDVDLGAAVVSIDQPEWEEGHAEPSHHLLWRAIGDGPWLLIEDAVPLGSSVTDPIPAIGDGTVNHYQVTTVSVLPSVAHSEVVSLAVPTRGKGGTGGWVYLNAGPGMSEVCRIRANVERSRTAGRVKSSRRYWGRDYPLPVSGRARSNEWAISARIAPDYDGASTDEELIDLQEADGLVCYRDPLGARWYGLMGELDFSHRSITGEVSWSMRQMDHQEGLSTADVVVSAPDEDDS